MGAARKGGAMKAKLRVWVWWLAVAAALILAVREVTWLDDRIAQHRAQRHADAIAKSSTTAPPGAIASKRYFPRQARR
jgi:hypothetical protein